MRGKVWGVCVCVRIGVNVYARHDNSCSVITFVIVYLCAVDKKQTPFDFICTRLVSQWQTESVCYHTQQLLKVSGGGEGRGGGGEEGRG